MRHAWRGLLLSAWVSACSGYPVEQTGTAQWAVLGGENSKLEEDQVLFLSSSEPEHQSCSATLIAPNAVLTALHCLSKESPSFVCTPQGDTDEQGYLKPPLTAESLELRAGLSIADSAVVALGQRLFTTGSDHICRSDLAVIVLDRDLKEKAAALRLKGPIERGEVVRVVGYSQYGLLGEVDRHTRLLPIVAVGRSGNHKAQGVSAPNTFVVGQGLCNGDSGGPAFSAETDAIVGVYSLLAGPSCDAAGVTNVFTAVHPFADLIEEALDYAGHAPLKEWRPPSDAETDSEARAALGSGSRRESASCTVTPGHVSRPPAPSSGAGTLAATLFLLMGLRGRFARRPRRLNHAAAWGGRSESAKGG